MTASRGEVHEALQECRKFSRRLCSPHTTLLFVKNANTMGVMKQGTSARALLSCAHWIGFSRRGLIAKWS